MASDGMSVRVAVRDHLMSLGAGLVGYGDMTSVSALICKEMQTAISIALPLNPAVVAGIEKGPTREYHAEYLRANHALDLLAHEAAEFLVKEGFRALPFAPTNVGIDSNLCTRLPHKTAATRAGLGWIGKCALLVTEEFGSAVRLTTVLTDADLPAGRPIDESRCGECVACVQACPGGAPSGRSWRVGIDRETFFDAFACRKAAREMAARIGIEESVCGMCIAACPWTQRYIERKGGS